MTAPANSQQSVYYLEVKGAELSGQHFEVGANGLLIGRAPDCDAIFESRDVSRRHCYFYMDGDACHLKDMGSRNGLFVNGVRIRERRLVQGDVVDVGPSRLIVRIANVMPASGARSDLFAALDAPILESPVALPKYMLAMASVVFAMMAWLHWGFGLSGLVLALLAVVEHRRTLERPGVVMVGAAAGLAVVGGVMNIWFAVSVPALRESQESAAHLLSQSNLARIDTAIRVYQLRHEGRDPESLRELVSEGLVSSEEVICPRSTLYGRPPSDYTYLPSPPGYQSRPNDVLIYDSALARRMDDGGWVLRRNGRMERISPEQLAVALADMRIARRISGGGQ